MEAWCSDCKTRPLKYGRLENQESRIGTGTGKPEQEQEPEPEPE